MRCDGRKESQVGHVISLVQHQDCDPAQRARAAGDVIFEPPGVATTMSTPDFKAVVCFPMAVPP